VHVQHVNVCVCVREGERERECVCVFVFLTDCPSGLSPKIWPAAHFDLMSLACGTFLSVTKSGLRRIIFIKHLLHSGMHLI